MTDVLYSRSFFIFSCIFKGIHIYNDACIHTEGRVWFEHGSSRLPTENYNTGTGMYLIRGFIVNGGLVKQIRHIKVCTVVGYGNEHLLL